MSRYSATKSIPSCNISKALLEDLEKYILRKGKEITGEKPEEIKYTYSFVLEDKLGEETLGSISEYNRSRFPDDIRQVTQSFYCYSDPHVRISLSFGLDKWDSEIRAESEAPNSKEIVLGVIYEIVNIIKDYRNLNYIFWGRYATFFAALGLGSSVYALVSIIVQTLKDEDFELDIVISGFLFLTFLIHYLLSKFNPYCMFDTRRNGIRTKNIHWIINSIGGGLIVGLLINYLIKLLFQI